jgi:hypothetical protein
MPSRRPTSHDFKRALKKLERPTAGQRKFLAAHYRAVGRAATMTALANAAGYSSYGGVNLQYGLLAASIAKALRLKPPRTRTELLAEFVWPESLSNREFILVMRPAFARALKDVGWV